MYSRASLALRFALSLMLAAWLSPIAFAAASTLSPLPARATTDTGHSAMWYSPAREGEGWVLEVLPEGETMLHWHTFDNAGNPRWLTGTGRIHHGRKGDELHFERLMAVHGPRFGSQYNPADAIREHVGRATLRFNGCDSGEILFDAYGRQGRFPLARRSLPMAAAANCRPTHGTPGEPAQPYIGPAGSWHDPAYEGQSLSLAWTPSGDAHVAWFTFDTQGNPYWLTGTGTQQGGRIVFPALHAVRGGRFADPFDSDDVTRTSWGRLELTLACDTGQATYAPTAAGFAAGRFDLQRLTGLTIPGCASITAGHSGLWDGPASLGEGWLLEILPDDEAAIYGFGFDAADKPRWFTGTGRIHRSAKGEEIRFDHLIATHGPRFGEPGNATHESIGHATLRFHDCGGGEIAFTAWGQQASLPLNRRTRTMAADGCRPIHGTPGEPIQPYAGQSGTWHNSTHAGQHLALTWSATGEAKLLWLTFDAQGEPYWLTGTGRQEGERIVFPALYLPERDRRMADVFGTAKAIPTDDETVQIVDEPIRAPSAWGRLELMLGCDAGEAAYFPTEPGFIEGGFALRRQTRLKGLECPWVRPKPKLTDLYDLEWTELPIPAYTTPQSPVHFEMHSIADDGTVVGGGRWDGWAGIVRLRPGEAEWEKMLEGGGDSLITPDGKTIYAYRLVPAPPEETIRPQYRQLMMWREATGWQPLPGIIYPYSIGYGRSQNGKWLVGEGYFTNGDRPYPWKWSEETGQVTLEGWATPLAISDDGHIAAGTHALFTRRAIMWINGVESQYLVDNNSVELGVAQLCNADCSLVAGFYQHPLDNGNPDSLRAWYRQLSGAVTYLDMPESAFEAATMTMSADGSLIFGTYLFSDSGSGRLISEGWLWSEDMGTVPLRDILEGDGEFQFTDRWTRGPVAVSSDGARILFSGTQWAPVGSLHQYRAGVLRLIPKASVDAIHHGREEKVK